MTIVATDTFTGADGTLVNSRNSDSGHSWTMGTANAGAVPQLLSNKLRYAGEQFVTKVQYLSWVPANADYMSQLSLTAVNAGERAMAGVRISTSAHTGYYGGFVSPADVNIYKFVAGTFTAVGSNVNCTLSAGVDYLCQMEAIGTTLKLYVQRLSDNLWLTGPNTFGASRAAVMTVTDSSITAAGRAGHYAFTSGTTAFSVDNLLVDDLAVASVLSGTVTLDDLVASGSLSSIASSLTGTIALDDLVASGSLGAAPGVLTTTPVKNWSGTILGSATIPKVAVLRVSDMALVLNLTNQVTSAGGILTITNAALVAGTQYLLVTCSADGSAFGAQTFVAT